MNSGLFSILIEDHHEARQLMEDIIYSDQDRRHDLFVDLSDALLLHMEIEEQFFYPRLENYKRLVPAMKDALREHEETKELLGQLDAIPVDDARWQDGFRLMQQGLLKHMQIEEGDVFEKCTDFLTDSDLNEIAEKCLERKRASGPTAQRQPEERL